jgi:hypothetical protein
VFILLAGRPGARRQTETGARPESGKADRTGPNGPMDAAEGGPYEIQRKPIASGAGASGLSGSPAGGSFWL